MCGACRNILAIEKALVLKIALGSSSLRQWGLPDSLLLRVSFAS